MIPFTKNFRPLENILIEFPKRVIIGANFGYEAYSIATITIFTLLDNLF